MNWRRGFFRLWVVATVAWLPMAFILVDGARREAIRYNVGHVVDRHIPLWPELFATALIPPVIAFIGYFAVRWVVRGFR